MSPAPASRSASRPQKKGLAVFHALQRILPFGLCRVASRNDVNQLLEQLNERRCRERRTVERKSLVRQVLLRARDKATGALLQCAFGRLNPLMASFSFLGEAAAVNAHPRARLAPASTSP
jgi:hypothetical protein